MKVFAGLFFILGIVILVFAGLSTDYYKAGSGMPYFAGGFIVGSLVTLRLLYTLLYDTANKFPAV